MTKSGETTRPPPLIPPRKGEGKYDVQCWWSCCLYETTSAPKCVHLIALAGRAAQACSATKPRLREGEMAGAVLHLICPPLRAGQSHMGLRGEKRDTLHHSPSPVAKQW